MVTEGDLYFVKITCMASFCDQDDILGITVICSYGQCGKGSMQASFFKNTEGYVSLK